MTGQTGQGPIMGYTAIAAAVGRAIGSSVCVKSAKRYARRPVNRLPVHKFGNGRVYLRPEDLALWAAAWRAALPVGGVLVGAAA